MSAFTLDQINNLKGQSKIDALEKAIHHHNLKYFIDNDAEISDEEFDEMTQMLLKLQPNSSVLYELVGDIGDVIHKTPMLSIDKKFSHKDITRWVKDSGATKFLVQPKYDGMRARYQNGVLATRGNGIQGENITHRFNQLNIIGDLPKDMTFPVDGEIIIPLTYFDEHLSNIYKNPRNAVVGIVKSKKVNPEGIKALLDGGVHFVLHNSAFSTDVNASQLLDEDEWELLLEQKLQANYPLDGVVIKVKDTETRTRLGSTQHHYRWEVAYKLPAERKWTEVVNIKDQVGRTGRVTSVATIKPVQLSGATVTNVTLHNYEYAKASGIDIGSRVEVTRSGEVIPFITKVKPAKESSIGTSKETYKPPTRCPVCDAVLKVSGKYLQCINQDCPARKAQSFEYFFKTLGVDELGLRTVERFINEFHIENVTDFYDLAPEQIAPLDGFGKKSANNIVSNIENTLHQTVTPQQLLQALGIREMGPATSKQLVSYLGFYNLPTVTLDSVSEVEGMGPIKGQYFLEDIKSNWWIVENLKSRGLEFAKQPSSNKLEGLSFAITGKKEKYSRGELVDIIEQNGGGYKPSITKRLSYLIAGEEAGSKLDTAKKHGVKVINEKEFLEMV